MGRPAQPTRPYDSTKRKAAAERHRLAIVEATKRSFEERGWSGTSVRRIAEEAGVSQKTVEARFGTKAALLQAAVDFAIRGDLDTTPMPERDAVRRMEQARSAAAMLALHAAHLRSIHERSAGIARAVEQAAPQQAAVAELWNRMNRNRAFGVGWAVTTLLSKTGLRRGLTREEIETAMWLALDWGTYRTLTTHAGLDADGYEAWLRRYYESMFLRRRGAR
jgi:AcrR family transcriptional regulator